VEVDTVEIDAVMGDSGVVHDLQLRPEVGKLLRRQCLGALRKGTPVGTGDDQGVPVVGHARGDHLGDTRARLTREHGDEAFVLHVLQAAAARPPLAVAVPGRSPRAGDHLAVPRVAPVDLHLEHARAVVTLEERDPLAAEGHGVETIELDPQPVERTSNPRERGEATGGTEDHVEQAPGEEPDRNRRDRTRRERRAEEQRPDELQADQDPAEPPERQREVRRSDREHRAGDCDRAVGEDRRPVGVDDVSEDSSAMVGHDLRGDRGRAEGDQRRDERLARHERAVPDQRHDDEHHDPAHGAPESDAPDGVEHSREVAHQRTELLIEVLADHREDTRNDQQPEPRDRAQRIDRSTRSRIIASGGEELDALCRGHPTAY
jgi:hypothetical protein